METEQVQAENTPFSIPQHGYLQIISFFSLLCPWEKPFLTFSLNSTCSGTAQGGGVETEGGSQLFETAEKGGVMKNGPLKGEGSCKYVSVIMYPQKKKEVLYLVKKTCEK